MRFQYLWHMRLASLQFRKSLGCSHTFSRNVGDDSSQNVGIYPHQNATHEFELSDFSICYKYQNIVNWHICFNYKPSGNWAVKVNLSCES